MTGLLEHSPARILAELLIDLGLAVPVGSDASWEVYASVMADSPDEAIAVVNTTGKHDGREMIGGVVYERYGFQIMARSRDDNSVWTKTNNIAVALDTQVNRTFVPIGSATYRIQSVSRTGAILYVGFDGASKRRMYSINGFVSLKQMSGTGSYS